MGKRRGKKDAHSKTFPIKITIGLFLLLFVHHNICFVNTNFNFYTETSRARCKATITANESSWVHRWTSNNYLYEFNVGDKTYIGNSLIKVGNKEKIGDSIEVLYFEFMPSFNRPVSFYEDE